MDQATATRSRISYARICVEVSADHQLPGQIRFSVNGDQDYILHLEYDRRPPRCSRCCVFGHGDAHCPLQPAKEKAVWKAKQVSTVATEQATNPAQGGQHSAIPLDAMQPSKAGHSNTPPEPATMQQAPPTRPYAVHTNKQQSPPKQTTAPGPQQVYSSAVHSNKQPSPGSKRQKGKQTATQGNSSITIPVKNRFLSLNNDADHEEQEQTDQAGPSTVAGGDQPDPQT